MAYYRTLSLSFWTDRKIDDEFTPEDKYFYLYLLTNPHTNICGCYEISMKQMSSETGYNEETVKRLLNRMQNEHKVIFYDSNTKEVFILNWSKYNWSKSEKLIKAVSNDIQKVKSKEFKKILTDLLNNNISINNIISNIKTISYSSNNSNINNNISYITETVTDVSIGYGYPMDTVSNPDISAKSKNTVPNHEKITCDYTDNEELRQSIRDFIKMRKAIKSPMTEKAVELLLRNLDKLEPTDDNKKIAIINQSIERGWKTVYPIKDNAEEKAAPTDIEEYKAVINDFLY